MPAQFQQWNCLGVVEYALEIFCNGFYDALAGSITSVPGSATGSATGQRLGPHMLCVDPVCQAGIQRLFVGSFLSS